MMEIWDKHRKHQEMIEQLINKVNVLKQENRVIMKEPCLVKEPANRYELFSQKPCSEDSWPAGLPGGGSSSRH